MEKSAHFYIKALQVKENRYHFLIESKADVVQEEADKAAAESPLFRFLFTDAKGRLSEKYSMPPNMVMLTEQGDYDVEGDFFFFDNIPTEGEWGLAVRSGDSWETIQAAADIGMRTLVCCENTRYVSDYQKYLIPENKEGQDFAIGLREKSCVQPKPWKIEKMTLDGKVLTIALKGKVKTAAEIRQLNFVLYSKKSNQAFRVPISQDAWRQKQIVVDFGGFHSETYADCGKMNAYVEVYGERNYTLYVLKREEKQGDGRAIGQASYENSIVVDEQKEAVMSLLPVYGGPEKELMFMQVDCHNLPIQLNTIDLTGMRFRKGKLNLTLTFDDCGAVAQEVQMVYRSKVETIIEPMEFTVKPGRKGKVRLQASIDLRQVELKQNYWDFYVLFQKGSVRYRMKIRHQGIGLVAWSCLKDAAYRKDGFIAYPYFARNHTLVLCYREESKYDTFGVRVKEVLAIFSYFLLKPYWSHRNLWLVYEKFSETAQDNAYYFFKYCMENLSAKEKKHIYYIIDKNSVDYHNVEKYGKNVIKFMSLKHCLYYMAAKIMISTDSRTHAYAWRAKNSLLLIMARKKKLAFLQHGVTAFKKVDHIFGKKSPSNISLFFVTSQFEQDIIYHYFGFKREEIPITGFTRWDALEDKRDEKDKQILLMPTWRNWLEDASEQEFVESDYFKNYMALINDAGLGQELAEKHIRLMMYIHPKFRNYIGDFSVSNPQVTLIPFGEQPLNELIMSCSVLITDYSSVAWDVYYMDKPVVFYQFDYDLYNLAHKSYIDMEKELIGDRVTALPDLITVLKEYVDRDFAMKEQYEARRMNYYDFQDRNNCQRTYDVIKDIG